MKKNPGLVIDGPLNIQLREIPVPEPGADEVLIRVKYVAICGSDVKLYLGTYTAPHRYPVTIGHEWVGVVTQAGAAAGKNWQPGDVVTGDCSVFCGRCRYCAINRNHCISIEKRGITVDGGCAKYITVNQRHIYRCPALADIKPLVLSEPLAVAVNGITKRVPQNVLNRADKALILGCGSIGILSAFSLLQYGIAEITLVDVVQKKLDVVAGLGFGNIKTIKTDVSASDGPLTAEYDLIVEAAGSPRTLKKAFEIAKPCAHVVCLGHQQISDLDFGTIVKKSLTIHASNGSTGGFPGAIEIIQRLYGQISSLISEVVPLNQAAEFFENQLKDTQNIKTVIDLS